jgi:nucleoside 2-deoxyribosyltransferase
VKIFFAAPLTAYLVIADGGRTSLETSLVNQIGRVLTFLRNKGHRVFSAHERESWGQEIFSPRKALRLDLDGIDDCELFLALIGNPPSPGVQLELGYAIARQKPIVAVYTQKRGALPHLVRGLRAYPKTRLIRITSVDDWIEKIYEDHLFTVLRDSIHFD